jgi:hypothetical protein
MLTHTVTDARAWRAATVDDRASWYYRLSDRCLAAIDETIDRLRQQPRTTTDLRVSDTPLAECADDLAPVRTALEAGRGFAILEGPTEPAARRPSSRPATGSSASSWARR